MLICPNLHNLRKSWNNKGITLIELILYTGLLIVMLSVFYELFSLAGVQKLREFTENELYMNGQRALFEIQSTLKQASVVDEPTLGISSDTLRLDGGTTIITVNANNELIKTQGVVSRPLTDQNVLVDAVAFRQVGPSTESPTVEIELTLTGRRPVEGRTRTETFKSSITLR